MEFLRRHKLLLLIALAVLVPLNVLAFQRLKERYDPAPGTEAGADGSFSEDAARARELSRSSGRPLFMLFTNSDSCPICKLLDTQIFPKPLWREYAARRLVLLKLDYPRRKQLPPALVQQNDLLAKQHGIDRQPIMILFTPDGRELGRPTNNLEPAEFVAEVSKLIL